MTLGDTCLFRIKAKCGAPAFKPSNSTGFAIEYLEFDIDEIEKVTPQGKGKASNDTSKKASPPMEGLPPRIAAFARQEQQQQQTQGGMTPKNQGKAGMYKPEEGGAKAFGNMKQGAAAKGNKTATSHVDCKERTVLITVTATQQSAATTSMLLELNDVEFTEISDSTSTGTNTGTTGTGTNTTSTDSSNANFIVYSFAVASALFSVLFF